ncbi:helix-turn-helix transcriptional regulator [Phenylobacterium montanum]|uniref:YafY family transcriptional regulator n=1 Tax=Phenylobacterium montanum TaxID=2823693 RepID=A0A975G0U9_9CAUL|nr:YafY family protein [Caulobacter sp. S6]QUD87881.1 YafY family transcriptional regulator [Caulobacter sp. S6]
MRASRLLSILTTLQAQGHVTAPALAEQCEVSLRTIYRDIDALSAAGVPVYAERGSAGGYRLLDGYRTRLNGLSAQEAAALFLTGLPGPAADLGLGAVMAGAQNKLLAAMPAQLRAGAAQMRARFHLDAPAWFAEAEQPAHLPLVAGAVWDQRRLSMRYQSWRGEKARVVEPLGLVLKSGAWYMVGQVDGSARTYRVGRILELQVLDQRFARPEDFDLEQHWRESAQRLEAELHRTEARVRFSPMGVRMQEVFLSPYVRGAIRAEPPDRDGWVVAVMPVGSIRQAASELLRFGAEVEVLEPEALRSSMASIAGRLAEIYAAGRE